MENFKESPVSEIVSKPPPRNRVLVIVRDEAGYLVTGPDLLRQGRAPECWPLARTPFFLETSVPGSFAAGAVRHGSVKRVASAVGDGAMAVTFVHRYLEETA
jgi:thioredoxin reductase (NADPH)